MQLTILELKIFSACLILLSSVAGAALYAVGVYIKATWLLVRGDAFSRGIFLGITILHLLPEAMEHCHELVPQYGYALTGLICIVTMLLFMVLEKRINRHNGCLVPFALLIMLAIHGVFEGYALGIQQTFNGVMVLLLAIAIHKWCATFAIFVNLAHSGLTLRTAYAALLFFALMTPLGILLGAISIEWHHILHVHTSEAIFDAVAAGTFLYAATMHVGHENHTFDWLSHKNLGGFVIGLIVSSATMIWL